MLKAIFATVLGAFIGALVGLDLQTRFHLGVGAWTTSGLVGAVVGFLTFKPTEVFIAFKKTWREIFSQCWFLPGYSTEYRKLWKQRAIWSGLSGSGIVSTICCLVLYGVSLRDFPTTEEMKHVATFIVGISIALGIEIFLIVLFDDGRSFSDELLAELVTKNKQRFLFYCNPIAVRIP
jgi:hypothetical protein